MDEWQKRIQDLCTSRKWSMRKLAGDIGVSPSYLHDVATGKSPASPMLKLKLIGRVSWTGSIEQLMRLLPEEAANIIKDWETTGLQKLGEVAEDKLQKKEQKALAKPPAKKSKTE